MSDTQNGGMEVVELDTVPSEEDQGVKDVLHDLESQLEMKGNINMIKSVGEYLYVSTNAAAKDAKQLVQIQDCLFNVIKLNDACALMLQSFQSGANNILEKLKIAYLYLLDGFPDFAMADIEAISKDIGMMKEAVGKHMKSEKTLSEMITGTHDVVKTELQAIPPRISKKKSQEEEKKREIEELDGEIRHYAADDDGVAAPPELESHTRNRRVSKLYLILLLAAVMKSYFWCQIFDKGMLAQGSVTDSYGLILYVVPIIMCLLLFIVRKKRGILNLSLACTILFLLLMPGLNRQLQPEAVTEATSTAQNNVTNEFPGTPEADLVHHGRRSLYDVKTKDNEHAHEPNGRGDQLADGSRPKHTDGQDVLPDEPSKEDAHKKQPDAAPKESGHKDGPVNDKKQKQTSTGDVWYGSNGATSSAQQTADSSRSEGSYSEGEMGKSTISDADSQTSSNQEVGLSTEGSSSSNDSTSVTSQNASDTDDSKSERYSEGETGKSTISDADSRASSNQEVGSSTEGSSSSNDSTSVTSQNASQVNTNDSKSDSTVLKKDAEDADSHGPDNRHAQEPRVLGVRPADGSRPKHTDGQDVLPDEPSKGDGHKEQPGAASQENGHKDGHANDDEQQKETGTDDGRNTSSGEKYGAQQTADSSKSQGSHSEGEMGKGTISDADSQASRNQGVGSSTEGSSSSNNSASVTGQTASVVNTNDSKSGSTVPKKDAEESTTSDVDSEGPDNRHVQETRGLGDLPADGSRPKHTDGQDVLPDEPSKEDGHKEQPGAAPQENGHKDGPANDDEQQKQTRTDDGRNTSSGEKSGAQQTADSSKSQGSHSEGEMGKGNQGLGMSRDGSSSSNDGPSATGQTVSAVNEPKDDNKPDSTVPKKDATMSDEDSQGAESSKEGSSSSHDDGSAPGQTGSAVNRPKDDSKSESTTSKEETGERSTSDEDTQVSTQEQESEEEECSTTEGVPPDSQFAGKYPGGEYEDNTIAMNKFLFPVASLTAVRFDDVKFGWVDLKDRDDGATESKAFCVTLLKQNMTVCVVYSAGISLFEKHNGTCHGLDTPYLNFLKVCFKPGTFVNRSKCSQPSLLLLFALTVAGFTVFLVVVVVVSLALRCFRRDKPKPVVDEEGMDDDNVRLMKEELSAIARDKTEIAQRELSKIRTELKQEKELLESTELTNVLFNSCLPYLTVIEGILSNSINLVENWYKECKDVVEPNVGRNITRAADIKEEDRSGYWNSLQFKNEVIGCHCRWRALQVYCGESRGLIRSTQRIIKGWHTEKLRPNEAVIKSWQQAAALKDEVKQQERIRGVISDGDSP